MELGESAEVQAGGEAVKPCAHCGHSVIGVDLSSETVQLICHKCGASGPKVKRREYVTPDDAEDAAERLWDNRDGKPNPDSP